MSDEQRRAPMSAGIRLKEAIANTSILPFNGIYDVFSASLAARHIDNLLSNVFGYPVSHTPWPGREVIQRFQTAVQISIIAAVECGAGNAD